MDTAGNGGTPKGIPGTDRQLKGTRGAYKSLDMAPSDAQFSDMRFSSNACVGRHEHDRTGQDRQGKFRQIRIQEGT